MGYEIEGTLRRHLLIKGELIDQHVMAKLLV
jgi:RimJ/RimL family protein N-acetyltransferase